MGSPAVEMRAITKRFPSVIANDKVDFTAYQGELHALIGENGAGKTTLMNILYGMLTPDHGEIRIFGKPVRIQSPRDAISLKIGMVHQRFMLVQAFTALENIILGCEPTHLLQTDYHSAEKRLREICEQFGLYVDLHARVADLSVSSQQKVEILKALYRQARILILDEPTSVLAPQEVESLFAMLRRLVEDGMCIILISHKLREVLGYSDRVTVLRHGKSVACLETTSTTAEELTRLMVGSEGNFEIPRQATKTVDLTSEPILKVSNLRVIGESGVPAVNGLSFELYPGEILGVAGIDGNGQRELAEALIGLRKGLGSIKLDGREIIGMSVRQRLKLRIAYIPEDRRFALLLENRIIDNAILGSHWEEPIAKAGILNIRACREHASRLIENLNIRAIGPEMAAGQLSGGNQQKLVFGRALEREPRLLIASQPTCGLDVSASAEVRMRLIEACNQGAGILLISYDLDEILSLSDRVMVMFQGRIAGILKGEEATPQNVGALMLGEGILPSSSKEESQGGA